MWGQQGLYRADPTTLPAFLGQDALFRSDPRLNGFTYGFIEMDRNGHRIIGHIGSVSPLQYSTLALLPEEGVGLFVAYNGSGPPAHVEGQTVAAFMNRFYPAPAMAPPVPPADFGARAEQFTGEYQRNNFGGSYTTFEKLARILGNSNRRITNPGDGTLEVSWAEAPTFNVLLLAACTAVFGSTLLAAAVGWVLGRAHRTRAPHGRLLQLPGGRQAEWRP